MNNIEGMMIKDKKFWVAELAKSGVFGNRNFLEGNVSTGRQKPETHMGPNYRNVLLDGNYCDVYLFAGDNNLLDVFIYIKEGYTTLADELNENEKEVEVSFNQFSTDNSQSDRAQIDAEKHEG